MKKIRMQSRKEMVKKYSFPSVNKVVFRFSSKPEVCTKTDIMAYLLESLFS
jgi:hypothetical protein